VTTDDDILAAIFEEFADAVVEAPGPTPAPSRAAPPPAAIAPPDPSAGGSEERLTTEELRRACARLAEAEDRMGWPGWWWDDVTVADHAAIRRLWNAVAAQVARDAANPQPTFRAQRREARAWLTGHARDRAFVCGLIDRYPQKFSTAALAWADAQEGAG